MVVNWNIDRHMKEEKKKDQLTFHENSIIYDKNYHIKGKGRTIFFIVILEINNNKFNCLVNIYFYLLVNRHQLLIILFVAMTKILKS